VHKHKNKHHQKHTEQKQNKLKMKFCGTDFMLLMHINDFPQQMGSYRLDMANEDYWGF